MLPLLCSAPAAGGSELPHAALPGTGAPHAAAAGAYQCPLLAVLTEQQRLVAANVFQ